jgi:hypothetical protein
MFYTYSVVGCHFGISPRLFCCLAPFQVFVSHGHFPRVIFPRFFSHGHFPMTSLWEPVVNWSVGVSKSRSGAILPFLVFFSCGERLYSTTSFLFLHKHACVHAVCMYVCICACLLLAFCTWEEYVICACFSQVPAFVGCLRGTCFLLCFSTEGLLVLLYASSAICSQKMCALRGILPLHFQCQSTEGHVVLAFPVSNHWVTNCPCISSALFVFLTNFEHTMGFFSNPIWLYLSNFWVWHPDLPLSNWTWLLPIFIISYITTLFDVVQLL